MCKSEEDQMQEINHFNKLVFSFYVFNLCECTYMCLFLL